MKKIVKNSVLLFVALCSLASAPLFAQSSDIPRTPDGKPDFNGIWQALGTAHWDLQTHASRPGPVVDGELLLERAAQLLPDQARHGVVATTGRLRHQHTHRFHRIALRQHTDRRQPQRRQQRHTDFIFHLHFPSVMSSRV